MLDYVLLFNASPCFENPPKYMLYTIPNTANYEMQKTIYQQLSTNEANLPYTVVLELSLFQ